MLAQAFGKAATGSLQSGHTSIFSAVDQDTTRLSTVKRMLFPGA